VVSVLLLGGGMVFGVRWLVRFVEHQRVVREGPPPPLVEPTADEFHRRVSGFRQKDVGVSPADLRSIERFFREAVAVRDLGEGEAPAQRLLDGDRFLQELDKSPSCPPLRIVDRRDLVTTLGGGNPFQFLSDGWRILHVELKGNEAVVYLLTRYARGAYEPMRWWLVRRGSGPWRAFNWEETEMGRSQVEHVAINMGLVYHAASAWNQFSDAIDALDRIDPYPSPPGKTAATLAELEQRSFHPHVQDFLLIRLAQQRFFRREYHRCLAVCDRISRPEIRPVVYRLRAECLAELGRWQEALAAAEKYDKHLGCSPVVNDAAATALANLGRREEAAIWQKKSLALLPDNQEALRGLAQVLPDEDKSQLIEHVGKLPRARRVAVKLVEYLADWEEEESARALADWLAGQAPDSYEALAARGRIHELDEEHLEAAQCYRQALAKLPGSEQDDLTYRFLAAMCRAKKPLEAYEQSADKRSTLATMYGDYCNDMVMGLVRDNLFAIVERHKRNDPEDPQLPPIEAHLLSEAGRDREAEMILRAAAAKDPNLGHDLVRVLLDQGKWQEAYQARPPGFDLQAAISQLRYGGRLAEARAFFEHHRQQAPDDPSLGQIEIELLIEEGRFADAWLKLLPLLGRESAGQSPSPDQWLVQSLAVQLLASHPDLIDQLGALAVDDAWWSQVAARLDSEDQIGPLQKLTTAWRKKNPQSTLALRWAATGCVRAEDHASAAALLAPAFESSALPLHEQAEIGPMLVRSLLNTGRLDEARRYAERLLAEQQYVPLLLVHVQAGDVDGVRQVMDRAQRETNALERFASYHEEGLEPLLADPKYLAVRKAYPPRLSYGYVRHDVVILTKDPPNFPAEELNSRLAPVLPQVRVEALPELEGPPECRWFLASSRWSGSEAGENRWLIAVGHKPYLSAERLQQFRIADGAIGQALTQHGGWIGIGCLDAGRRSRRVLPLAAALAPESALVHVQDAGRLAVADRTLLAHLRERNLPALKQTGVEAYLYRDEPESQATQITRRQWRTFARTFRQRPVDGSFRVQVRVFFGEASERLWFSVARLDGSDAFNCDVVGICQTSSRLDPHLRPGEPRRMGRYQVVRIEAVSAK
jgi:tetratricopeptide (TPR) repeat protein